MNPVRIATGPWGAAALGSAGTLALLVVGPAALASGWVAPTLGGLLAAAGLGVLAEHGLRTSRVEQPVPQPPPYVHPDDPEWDLCQKPAEWLSASGADCVPDAEIEGFVRARLAGCLRSLSSVQAAGWEEPLPEPVALLAVAFAARAACRDGVGREIGGGMLAGLREAMAHPEGPARTAALSGVRSWIAQAGERESAIPAAYLTARSAHGTRESLLMGLLQAARAAGGVLAPAEFVWLKGLDRGLWYALDSLGRQRFLVEGLAAMAHYRDECHGGRRSTEPRTDDAVTALAALCRDMRAGRAWPNVDPWDKP